MKVGDKQRAERQQNKQLGGISVSSGDKCIGSFFSLKNSDNVKQVTSTFEFAPSATQTEVFAHWSEATDVLSDHTTNKKNNLVLISDKHT